MPRAFDHTLRVLEATHSRSTVAGLVVTVLAFGAWASWLFLGRVSVYVASSDARIEVTPPPMPLSSAVDGIIEECNLALGSEVVAGTVLLRLESRSYELQAEEARATLRANQASLDALHAQLEVEQRALDLMARFVVRTARAGEVRVAANRAASDLKQKENDVMAKLTDAELASKLDSMRSLSEAEAQRLQVRVSSEQAALDTSNAKVTLQDRNIQVSSLRTEVVAAENNLAIEQAKLQTLEYEIERRTVRARATGTISDAIGCAPGITVTPATRLGTLLPRGEVHVVAHFEPRDVIGRATRGDKAIIRVENFPWTQFGTLAADVREVGSEPRDGLVRVELGVTSNNPQIPATHGLTATAEIEIERLSPARLLLRMAGQGSGNERKVSGASDAPASVANATPNALAR